MRRTLPADCALLPLARGALLVSRELATFCALDPDQAQQLEGPLASAALFDTASLDEELIEHLRAHGFFDPPRPMEDDLPSVQLQLTNACNLSCSYCCTNSGKPREGEVTLEQLLPVVRQAREQLGPGARLAILGGEPLLVPWALTLCKEAVDQGLAVTLFTNGVPLKDDALAKEAAELNRIGMEVRISLAGPNQPLCDLESGTARFTDALAGMHRLHVHGGEAVIDLMLFPQHVERVVADLPQLRQLLPPHWRIALGLAYHSGRETGQHFFGSPAALEDALDRITFEAQETIPSPKRGPLTYRREACSCALGNHLHLRSDGALFPCFKMEEDVGHLQQEGFLPTLKKLQQNPHLASNTETCGDCQLVTLCGGGCRSDNFLWTGDPDKPICGPWRVRLLSELLAEERVSAVDWPLHFLLAEARQRGIEGTPEHLEPIRHSRHLRG